MLEQCAHRILMVRPVGFQSNGETAVDNDFQHLNDTPIETIQGNALREFDDMVGNLRKNAIEVVVLQPLNGDLTPDAVYPNNWFSLSHSGVLTIFPMAHPSRQKEVRPNFQNELLKLGLTVTKTIDLRESALDNQFLEGTGSLVFDHASKKAFMAKSQRSCESLARLYGEIIGYEVFTFDTCPPIGLQPVYHTNVLLSILSNAAVVCPELIHPKDRNQIMRALRESRKTIIEINMDQVFAFAANILEVKNTQNQHFLVMSKSAHLAYSAQQLIELENNRTLIVSDLKTIEHYGGGSARCMLAELFA